MRMPLLTAGALSEFVCLGLTSLLRAKGVTQENAGPRAQAAVEQIGAAKIQAAMASSQPWREIKALANQVSPAFQLVLPSELEASLVAKASSGHPVGQTRKQRRHLPNGAAPARIRTEDLALLPEQVSIPTGVFTSPSGPLQQIRLDDVGPSTVGIVVVTPEQATRYLRIPRPISSEALGLVALGPIVTEGSTLHTESVRFHALCPSSGEPLLLNGLLLQVGDQYAVKHTPAVANLDVVQSVVQRISVYRDEWEGDWSSFTASPLKAIVACVPLLRTCDSEGCVCQSWHGLTSAGKPEAILEAWNRTFCTNNFRASPPASATIFTIYIRVPLALEEPLKIQSNARPSTQVLHTQHGEVLLSEVKTKQVPASRAPVVVASTSFLRTLASRHSKPLADGPDPLQTDDPWAKALAASNGPSELPRSWQQMASQVEKNVLAKVGAASTSGPGPGRRCRGG